MPLIGAHMSISGGFHKAIERIVEVKGKSLQIFSKNQRQWSAPSIPREDIERFKRTWKNAGGFPVAVHGSYLINLASPDRELAAKSVMAFTDELVRAASLGASYLIFHPGAHKGEGLKEGIANLVTNLDSAISQAPLCPSWILIETTAGRGTNLGSSFEEILLIMEKSVFSSHLGLCVDTAHVFAAGYDLRSDKAYNATMNRLIGLLGLDKIRFFHLNDSLADLGSRIDRHTHIGKGFLGLEVFRRILKDDRFSAHPMVIETPKGKGLAMDKVNIKLLNDLMEGLDIY